MCLYPFKWCDLSVSGKYTHSHTSQSVVHVLNMEVREGEAARLDVFDVVHLRGSPPHMSRLNEEQRGRPIGRLQAPPTM